MKKSNENISFAIYAILFAWNCLSHKHMGAEIHVEDKAPVTAKVAGCGGVEVTDPSTLEWLNKRAKSIGDFEIAGLFDGRLSGGAFNYEQCIAHGYQIGDHIVIFYETLLEEAADEEDLVRLAFEVVTHELRHIEQFHWLRDHGIDPTWALKNEPAYGTGPLEKDAWAIQKGAQTPIDEAMACFIK